MTNTPATTSSAFVGNIPEYYDRHLGPVIFEPYARDMARRVGALNPRAVLELAAGTGIVTRRLLEALPKDAALTATDLNPAMLDEAAKRIPPDPRLGFRPADAQALPFADASFDLVVCQFGVMFFPDKPLAMREAKRVLKPGGRYLFNVWGSFAENAYGRIAHETIVSFFPTDPPPFYLTPFGWSDEATVRATVVGAGFRDVTFEAVDAEAVSESAAHFAQGLVRGNPVSTMIQERGGDPNRVLAAVTDAMAKAWGAAPCRGPIRAYVVTATA